MERRSVLKCLGGFTAGILLASQANAQNETSKSDRIANEVFEVMAEAKESGKVRHIGFTGHYQPNEGKSYSS